MTGRIYNKVYDPKVWEKVNPQNKELLSDFILDLRENRRSPATVHQYFSDLRGFFCHLYRSYDNQFVLDLTKKDLKRYALALVEERNLSNARRNCMIASLHSMLEYAETDDDWDYEINASRLIKSLAKEPVRAIVFLEDATVMELFDELMRRTEYQKATLLMLSYESAGRRAELAQVAKESFFDPSCNNTNIVIGKGRKKFSLVYFEKTRLASLAWLEQRGTDDITDLFIGGNEGEEHEADPGNIYRMFCDMRALLKLDGAEIDFGPHSMRHSALTNYKNGTHHICRDLGKAGFSIDQLKYLAHHESADTTLSYLPDTTNEELSGMFGIEIKLISQLSLNCH